MTKEFQDISAERTAGSVFSDTDIAEMRRSLWEDGTVSAVEADTILLANDEMRGTSAEWTDFFVEAMAVYAVDAARPKGYVDDARARWFASRITDQGKLPGREELLLVVRILERATRVGDALRTRAPEAFLRAVTEGGGPTGPGGNPAPAGCLTPGEPDRRRPGPAAPAGACSAPASRDRRRGADPPGRPSRTGRLHHPRGDRPSAPGPVRSRKRAACRGQQE